MPAVRRQPPGHAPKVLSMPHPAANPDDLLRLALASHAAALGADHDQAWDAAGKAIDRHPAGTVRDLATAVTATVADELADRYVPGLPQRG